MKRNVQYPTDSLFRGLRTLLASLPSEDEKRELIRTLTDTRDFLDELQRLIEAFPTIESSRQLSHGLSHLDILAERAATNAPLRRLMGLKSVQRHRTARSGIKDDVETRAETLRTQLDSIESSDVANFILKSGEPITVLTELADALGLRTRKKERKTELVRRISTHITNQRGYEVLSGNRGTAG